MNTNPETDLDLEKLFLPAWAQESPSVNRYAKFTGDEGAPRGERRGEERRGPRPPRREGGPGGPNRGRRDEQRPRGPRREGGERRPQRQDRGPRRDDRREPLAPPPPLPEIAAGLLPDAKGVESISRQIKMTGRAFPLFDIAHLILQKPERYSIRFTVKKNAEGQAVQPMVLCALDDTVWLSEDEAVGHVLSRHFGTFYQAEKTATEPPKGTYTFVGQCGMSGVILGPPNYHDYQNKLRKLHAERFARMPFEVFKARVKIVRDEEVVKKWIEEQSCKTEYICLNVPEPLKLPSREEVEKHFRATHKENIIKPVESHVVSGVAGRSLRGGLGRVVQQLLLEQRRFPMQIATVLSQQFAQHGLQFFKVNKTVTHVAVARPHFLDLETTPVSAGVRNIVAFINANPKCTRRKLIEALAPTPAPASNTDTRAAESAATPDTKSPEGGTPSAAPAVPAAAAAPEPTAEQTAVISDLHWLVHQGHVIEFANGTLETAKKPAPRPPKPEKKAEVTETAPVAEAAASGDVPPTEAAPTDVPPSQVAPESGNSAPAATVSAEPPTVPGESSPSETSAAEISSTAAAAVPTELPPA